MGDENRGGELPHRVPGEVRAGPAPSPPTLLTQEIRQRMQAAVKAERAQAAEQDRQPTEPIQRVTESRPAGSDATPGGDGVRHPMEPEPSSKPERIIESGQLNHAFRPVGPVAPEHGARPQPATEAPAKHKKAATLPARPDGSPRPQPSVQEPGRRRLARTGRVAAVLVVIAAGALGFAVSRYLTSLPTDNRGPSVATQRQEVLARDQAATWAAQQVSHGAAVSCERVMCAALAAAGFPSRELRVLGPTSSFPVTSQVVVVTQAVRNWFGTILGSEWAPGVLATFGLGDAAITVRVIAPDGATRYRAALAADLAARKITGAYLLQVPGITVSAEAREQLIAGQVDSRLLLAIGALATNEPVDIIRFGNIGPGAGADMPLRFAELAANDQAAHLSSAAYVRSVRSNLGAVEAQYRPASIETMVLAPGQTVLLVQFMAPSPLGLLGPQGSH
jgi:hypothetical protein